MPSELQIGSITFIEPLGQLPPAPTDTPPAVRTAILEAISMSPETVIVSGVSTTRVIRFASGENQGWVNNAQKLDLMNLYLSGQPFAVVTDLLGPRESPVTFQGCFFDPGTGPIFGPHPKPDGNHWLVDLPVRMPMPS